MLPALFGKPRILTNYPGFLEYYALRKGDIFLPRLIKNKKDNKMLVLNKLALTQFHHFGVTNNMKRKI